MPTVTTPRKAFTVPEYDRMARDLDAMADAIRERPEMNHHSAERLALLAKQMREDPKRTHPDQLLSGNFLQVPPIALAEVNRRPALHASREVGGASGPG